jgi:hypothetical protein
MFRTALISMFLTSTAIADYTGLTCTSEVHGDGTWTARIYVNFDAATDHLSAVFGDSQDPLLITSSNGFYQNPFGGPTSASINPAFCALFPSLTLDSWVTICFDPCDGNGGMWLSVIGIDWTDFEGNGGDIYTENGSWSASSSTCENQYLIGQFTMFGLESHVSGVLNLQGIVGDFETFQARGQEFDFFIGPQTWTVDDDGKADFDNIQAAVDASSDSDEIVVMPGTYTSTAEEVVDMLGKEIHLHSSKGAEATIIDGEGTRRGITCSNGETSNTIIEGFTITGGYAYEGGGMYNNDSSPTLTNCTFTNNNALDQGGGMYNYYNSPTLINCTFTNNTTDGKGGGMHNNLFSSPTLTTCTFTDNTANYGGGMFNDDSSPTLTDCTFTDNTAHDGGGMRNVDNAGLGGGMHNYNSSPTLTYCTFTNNTTDGKGGGMYNYLFSSPTLANCTFTYNTVVDDGGGMYNYVDSSPHLIDCIFENNIANGNGGGMLNIINSNPTLTDTTVCGNTPDQIIGDWTDNGGNTIADECYPDCPDINADGYVNVSDLLAVIDQWGSTDSDADINGDGIVNVTDLLEVIGNWGACE